MSVTQRWYLADSECRLHLHLDSSPSLQKPCFRERHFSGWRMGVGIGAVIASIMLLINVIFISWITQTFPEDEPGLYTLIGNRDKSCEETKKWSTWLHLAINFCGTLLLGASNYCMQCLSSPTRSEVDRAHSAGSWLHIGIPNVSNMDSMRLQKVTVWLLVGLSSLPLHLV